MARERFSQDIQLLRCNTAVDLLEAVTPVLPNYDTSPFSESVRTFSRNGSREAPSGSYVLRLDNAGSIHVLRIEAAMFREVHLEASDQNNLFDSPESVDLVVVGTAFAERFDGVNDAIAAIGGDKLTPEEQVGVWSVPADPTRAFLVYERPASRTRE